MISYINILLNLERKINIKEAVMPRKQRNLHPKNG